MWWSRAKKDHLQCLPISWSFFPCLACLLLRWSQAKSGDTKWWCLRHRLVEVPHIIRLGLGWAGLGWRAWRGWRGGRLRCHHLADTKTTIPSNTNCTFSSPSISPILSPYPFKSGSCFEAPTSQFSHHTKRHACSLAIPCSS